MKFRPGILAGALALAVLSVPAPRPSAAAPPSQVGLARFDPAPCPYPEGVIPAHERVDCGYLTVPEDRTAASARTIRLAVAILRSPNPNPVRDPVLYLSGGPGSSALDFLNYWIERAATLRGNRDILLLDQRGTGYSEPNLDCWEFDALFAATRTETPDSDEWIERQVDTATQCRDRLLAEGVNLSAYNTAQSAADVKDLRVALGIFEWNLYGHSYGTRLALTVLRDFPGGVRSAVLSAPLPPQARWWEEAALNAERAFNQVFTGCARDRACATAFPDLQRRAFDIVDTLNASPLIVSVPDPATGAPTPQLVDGQGFLEGGFSAMYESELIPYLPLAVAQVSAGNYAVVEGFAANLGNTPIRGMWYSVMCHDEAPFNDPEVVAASQAAHPRYAEFAQFEAAQAVCALWGAGEAGPIEDEPVRSDVPTLLLHGAYDPIHPPAWGQIAASTLRNSTFILLPASGHGGGLGVCGQALAAEFIAQPGVAPANDCARAAAGPAWVTAAYINPGVYRLASGLLLQFDWVRALPFALCGVMFVSALLLWPVDLLRSFWRRPARGEWLGRWLAALVAALHLSFAVLLLIVINDTAAAQPYLLLFGLPPENAPLFIVPWVGGALSLGLAVTTFFAWRDRYWSMPGRIYFTLVTAAALGFFWLLLDWGLVSLS